ncbi:DUF983 domain-containing protein [Longitalea arenae]|uniref:DUF983 domain-containing protein n=1 Tax=Longitalea arenae TaxID=2812558 RepID=UPI0019685CA6|nr:DUF983 domain-containing protein [Longitalea arenae]
MPASSKPNFLWSILTMKCPRCRRGPMFRNNNPWKLKKVFDMPVHCEECGQKFEMEVGFWYGTGYVSYALSVALSVATFVAWYVLIGMSTQDNRFFWWLGINIFLLIVLQPWLMRISRVIYLYFFVRYDPNYKNTRAKKFDYETDSYYEGGESQQ